MKEFSTKIDIDAPPERVWSVMSNVERWPEWTPSVTRVDRLDRGPFAVGSRARIRQPKLLPAVWRVIKLEEGKSFTWISGGPGLEVTGSHTVEPRIGGSRATLSLQFSGLFGPFIAELLQGLNERYLILEANGLKRRSEGR